jgi:hypothetical protein
MACLRYNRLSVSSNSFRLLFFPKLWHDPDDTLSMPRRG